MRQLLSLLQKWGLLIPIFEQGTQVVRIGHAAAAADLDDFEVCALQKVLDAFETEVSQIPHWRYAETVFETHLKRPCPQPLLCQDIVEYYGFGNVISHLGQCALQILILTNKPCTGLSCNKLLRCYQQRFLRNGIALNNLHQQLQRVPSNLFCRQVNAR